MSKAANTKQNILRKSFGLIYRNGYQATSIDDILATTEVTKGAFYYHFKNKDQMAEALISDIIKPYMHQRIVEPITSQREDKPIDGIYETIENLIVDHTLFDIRYGCPVLNLIQEMAPLNILMNQSLMQMIDDWKNAIQENIVYAKNKKLIHADSDPEQIALFILCSYAGARNMGKIYGEASYHLFLKELSNYLENMKL